jgi:hypothetical protein
MPEREFPDLQGGCQVRLDLGLKKKKKTQQLGAVAHACNPSYSGGRDQKDHNSKPALGK